MTVSITGGLGDNFTNIQGPGAAAQLSIAQDVLLWGSWAIGGALTLSAGSTSAELDLEGGSAVTAGSLYQGNASTLEVTSGSSLQVSGMATLTNSFLLATAAGTVQLGSLVANGFPGARGATYGTIAVDDSASIEVGTAGSAALGAITIDAGQSAAISGKLYGNVVVNGSLAVQAGGKLSIDIGDPFGTAQSIVGTGTIIIDQNSQLSLGVVDTAAIQFADPGGTLTLGALPTGVISGFVAGDTIMLTGLATGLTYTQTSNTIATLTLTKGSTSAGTLTLAGNYSGSLFHSRLDAAGNAFITLQAVGAIPAQPALLTGTVGSDLLTATANNQTLTGRGGTDTLSGGVFTGVTFKDTSANLTGSTISSFVTSDIIDITDLKSGSVSLIYTPAASSLVITDGTNSTTLLITPATQLPFGVWSSSADGAGGTVLKYTTINTDAYAFIPSAGGLYSSAANWRDTTTSAIATLAPGIGNTVTVAGQPGYLDLTGNGVAAGLKSSSSVLQLGTLTIGSGLTGGAGGLLQTGTLALDSGASLSLTGVASMAGTVQLGGGSKLTGAAGVLFTGNASALLAIGGSTIRLASISGAGTTTIATDATSSIEFGSAASAKAGAVTIDAGITANIGGTIAGNIVVNGTLEASGKSLSSTGFGLSVASVTGSGTLEIDNSGTLSLAGSDSAGILFTQSGGTLSLSGGLPTGTITGFAQGDIITLGRLVTGLSYTQSTNSTGTLTLSNGGAIIGKLTFAGSYAAQQFLLQFANNGTSSTITYAATPGTTSGNQISSNTDSYGWTSTAGGAWNFAGNWTDNTTGKAAIAAPGSANAVIIQSDQGPATAQIISGSGSVASLSVYSPSSTVFTGTMAVGGSFYVSTGPVNGVALTGGARFTVGSLTNHSNLQINGGSVVTVTGLAGGTEIVGSLSIAGGSTFNAIGSFDIGGGSLGVDASSRFEYGTKGNTLLGALTVDAGQTASLEENGAIAANLVVNGTLVVNNGTVGGFGGTTGAITGTGTIQIGSVLGPGKLTLASTDSAALLFYQIGFSGHAVGYGTLELQGPLPTGPITGFITGDSIQLDQTVTGISYKQTTASLGTLTLTNGSATIGTLAFAGNYANSRFQVDVAAASGFGTITLLPVPPTTSTATATTGTDAYSWTGGSAGNWTTAANWTDTTTGLVPTTIPGNRVAVTVAGTATIAGNGAAASLTVSGRMVQTGQITVAGQVSIPATAGPSGTLVLTAGSRLTAASVVVAGTLEVGGASAMSISGAASLAGGTLTALNGSTIQVGTLLASGVSNVIAVDANSCIKIGSTTNAAVGAVTQAVGSNAVLAGSIYGNVVINGTLAVPGGGSLFIDMTGTARADPYSNTPSISGTGTLSLTQGSTLGLGAVSSAAIQFAGPNATLMLAALPTATIAGFAATDLIQIDQTVTAVSYQQGANSTGTLTLTNGATAVGTLTLAGNYAAGSTLFHLDSSPNGAVATISLQTLGIAASQPTMIKGTVLSDVLKATGNGQTLTGSGGNDRISAGGFAAVAIKDLTALMNGYTITDFTKTDWLDFTDLNRTSATIRYAGGVVSVSDGLHSANVHLAFTTTPTTGGFSISSDGATGSKVSWS